MSLTVGQPLFAVNLPFLPKGTPLPTGFEVLFFYFW